MILNKLKPPLILIIALSFILILYFNYNNNNYNPLTELLNYDNFITDYCRQIDLEKDLFISVVSAELRCNYDEFDKYDEIRARLGMDPSVGITQMKVSTFKWLEDNYGHELIHGELNKSENIVDRMIIPKINIQYSCFYVKLIINMYYEKYHKSPSAAVVASYYSFGIDHNNLNIDSSYINTVGEEAKNYYKLIKQHIN